MTDRLTFAAAIDQAEPEAPPSAHYDADAILSTTARMFGLEVDVLWGPSRSRFYADARAVAMLLMFAHTGLCWRQIGEMFNRHGDTCHTTARQTLGQPHRLRWAKAVQLELERTKEEA